MAKSSKNITLEIGIGSAWLKKADKAIAAMEKFKKDAKMPDKKDIEQAIDLMAEFREKVLKGPRLSEVAKYFEGKQTVVSLDFDKLTLDGTIALSLTPIEKGD